jgi:hypothetical protein
MPPHTFKEVKDPYRITTIYITFKYLGATYQDFIFSAEQPLSEEMRTRMKQTLIDWKHDLISRIKETHV